MVFTLCGAKKIGLKSAIGSFCFVGGPLFIKSGERYVQVKEAIDNQTCLKRA